jgi:hypothetical protein
MAKMDDSTLLNIIEDEERNFDDSDLESDRERAINYYYGKPYGKLAEPDIPDRSTYISRDVSDTIDWIMPALMKTFTASDEVVKFAPVNSEDVEAAKQETEYTNHVIQNKNHIYQVFSTWFDDALIQKNGYVCAYWKSDKSITTESYSGLDQDQITMLMQDGNVEIEDIETIIDPMNPQMQTFNVILKRVNDNGHVCIENIVPELARISWNHRSVALQDSNYCGYNSYKTISSLREDGYDVDDDISDSYGDLNEYDSYNRERYENPNINRTQDMDSNDPSMRVVCVRTRWVRVDYDGDGIAELRYIVLVGDTILENAPTDVIQMAAITPRIMPHSHYGRSVAETVEDLMEIKTTLMRGLVDNVVLANNARIAVDRNLVDLDDVVNSRPGGVIRTDGPPGALIAPVQHPLLGNVVMTAVGSIDAIKEVRTGVTKYNMGTDAGNLNRTATGISIISTAANQRIEWIARTFAETGVKDLFGIVHALIRKHQDKEDVFMLRNKWISVNPREWIERKNMSVSVGLGSTNSEVQMQRLTNLAMVQERAFRAGVVSPENVFNLVSEMASVLGYKDYQRFFTHPQNMPQQNKQDPKMEKIKADMINAEKDREIEWAKLAQDKNESDFDKQKQVLDMVYGIGSDIYGP